jgi:hypothetical protein
LELSYKAYWTMGRKKYLRLIEQRKDVRDAMAKALAEDNMAEYHRLNGHLIWLEDKIRKGKKWER